MKDFFVSYNRHDKQWAEWIAWTLEEAGYQVAIEAWDFRPGGNFVLYMQEAVTQSQTTIAVLSDHFLQAVYVHPEWAAAFARDPQGHQRALIPVRVAECQPTGLLAQIVYVDVVSVPEGEAAQTLLDALKERAKPTQKPGFPGAATLKPQEERVAPTRVEFPAQARSLATSQAAALTAPTVTSAQTISQSSMSTPTTTTILILSASPKGQYPLRLDEERREIEAGLLERSRHRDQFRLVKRDAVRPRDMQRAMLDVNPQIVHFSGHGQGEEGLLFEDETGHPQFVEGAALAALFGLFADQLQCVVLNACYSEVQAAAIAQHIPYVIGMSQAIGDRAAIEFAVGFYDALGAGRSIEFAFKLGCSAIQIAGIAEHLTPILKQKGEGAVVVPAMAKVIATPQATRTGDPQTPQATLSLSAYDAQTWVGRDDLIQDLTQKLEDAYRILVFTGMTGIGKTALAERLVVNVQGQGVPFHRLNFDDRGQGRDFLSGALSLLPKLGEPVTTADQQDPQNALKHLLDTLRSKPFLIQIDSLEMLLEGNEERGWNAFKDGVWVDFFQQLLAGEGCLSQILLTTQALPEELEVVGSQYPRCWDMHSVGGLSEAEQLALFSKNELELDEGGIETLKRIGKLYEGHPLVLQVIAKDILSKPFYGNVQQYWHHYQAEFAEGERDLKQGTSPRALQLRVKQRVEASLQRLPEDAYQMLCRASVYRRPVPEGFWLKMVGELTEERQWSALAVLQSHNLVEEEFRGDGVLLLRQHNLVRSVARQFLRAESGEWREANQTAAQVWLSDYPPESGAPKLEQVRGKLEAFHHHCEVEEWEAAKSLLLDEGVGLQLQTWSYYREMLPLYERLLGRLGAAIDVVCEKSIGNAYFFLSSYPQAIEHYQQSLETAREVGARDGEGRALSSLGIAYRSLGNYPRAIEYQQQSLTIAREIGNRQGEGTSLGNLGFAYCSLGNYSRAVEYHQQHLTLARGLGDRQGEGRALGNLGRAYDSLGNYPQAIEYHQESLTIARELGDRLIEGDALCGLGNAYCVLVNYPQAIEYYQQYLSIVREIGNRQGEGAALGNWGITLLKLEQYPEAQQHLQAALDIFKVLGFREGEAEILLRLGELHHQTGHPDQALDYGTQALSLARELGIPLLKECEALLATLQAEGGENA